MVLLTLPQEPYGVNRCIMLKPTLPLETDITHLALERDMMTVDAIARSPTGD